MKYIVECGNIDCIAVLGYVVGLLSVPFVICEFWELDR
jgi:hypothetical protein